MSKKKRQTADEMQAAFHAFFEAHNALPERLLDQVEEKARAICHEEGFSSEPGVYEFRVSGNQRKREQILARLPAETRAKVYTGPELPLRVRLAREGLLAVRMWRDSVKRGDARWAGVNAWKARTYLDEAFAIISPIRRAQTKKAKLAADKRWEETRRVVDVEGTALDDDHAGTTIDDIITDLARRTEDGDPLGNAALWSLFYARLDAEGASPHDPSGAKIKDSDLMTWAGNPKGMTFKTFKNRISEARK